MTYLQHLEKIAKLAACVVLETPARSANSFQSYVRRSLIKDIDGALREAGFDMDDARERMKQIEKAKQE